MIWGLKFTLHTHTPVYKYTKYPPGDTDPTCEDTTEKAVVVVSPLNALISDQMERRKSLMSGKNTAHMSSVSEGGGGNLSIF